MKRLKISVCMITYNHAEYLSQAIDGVLLQEGDFDLELVIADDASTDKSSEIINEYLNNHPKSHIIRYFRNEKNLGMMKNFLFSLNQCSGDYIAICEGDDFWTSSSKLQEQMNLLLVFKHCSFSFHLATKVVRNDLGEFVKDKIYPEFTDSMEIDVEEFFQIDTIPFCSVLMRKIDFSFLNEFTDHLNGDFLIYCRLLENGSCYFLNNNAAVYRKHENGVSFNNKENKYLTKRIENLNIEQNFFQNRSVKKGIKKVYYRHLLSYFIRYRRCNRFIENLKIIFVLVPIIYYDFRLVKSFFLK